MEKCIPACEAPTYEELLDRIAQSIFGIGLRLESCLELVPEPGRMRSEIDDSIVALHDVIIAIKSRADSADPPCVKPGRPRNA